MATDTFTQMILDKAKANIKHIVLPEGEDPRMIKAAAIVSQGKVARLTLLGNVEKISGELSAAGADMAQLKVVDPQSSEMTATYANDFYELRKNKGMTPEKALDIIKNPMYYGTMMVKKDDADGLVAGAVHSSADTIRPALQIIKAAPTIGTVSSMFFMCKDDTTYLYSDCGLNQDPDATQLADITLATARTAKQFGLSPKIAMLSYSTKGSAGGRIAEKMIAATELSRQKLDAEFAGEYAIDGDLQFDAAFVPAVASKKAPNSPIEGSANVFIFPDLGAGNICYKVTERLAGMNAYGPILQGIAKPVNDLSRGCSAEDIVSTIAITAIQAMD